MADQMMMTPGKMNAQMSATTKDVSPMMKKNFAKKKKKHKYSAKAQVKAREKMSY